MSTKPPCRTVSQNGQKCFNKWRCESKSRKEKEDKIEIRGISVCWCGLTPSSFFKQRKDTNEPFYALRTYPLRIIFYANEKPPDGP